MENMKFKVSNYSEIKKSPPPPVPQTSKISYWVSVEEFLYTSAKINFALQRRPLCLNKAITQ